MRLVREIFRRLTAKGQASWPFLCFYSNPNREIVNFHFNTSPCFHTINTLIFKTTLYGFFVWSSSPWPSFLSSGTLEVCLEHRELAEITTTDWQKVFSRLLCSTLIPSPGLYSTLLNNGGFVIENFLFLIGKPRSPIGLSPNPWQVYLAYSQSFGKPFIEPIEAEVPDLNTIYLSIFFVSLLILV